MSTAKWNINQNRAGWDYRAARLVSNIISPPLVSVLGFFDGLFHWNTEAWKWALIFVALVVLVPTGICGPSC